MHNRKRDETQFSTNLGSLLRGFAHRVTNSSVSGSDHTFLDEFVVNGFLDESATAGATALALVEEQSKVTQLHSFIYVSVGKNNVGTFATKFQSDIFQVAFARRLLDQFANLQKQKATMINKYPR